MLYKKWKRTHNQRHSKDQKKKIIKATGTAIANEFENLEKMNHILAKQNSQDLFKTKRKTWQTDNEKKRL